MSTSTRRGKGRSTQESAPGTNDTGTEKDPDTKPPEARRINVAVSAEVVRSLELVMKNEDVSLTEAVRRLIGYGDYVYRAIKERDSEVLIRDGDTTREVVLL